MKTVMFSKPKALMSCLPLWDFLVILLICPFMTSVTKIATQIYPKGKDDSPGNFFWISIWLAVVFTSWINSLGFRSLCTAFFSYFKGNVPLFCGLPQLFLVCRFHIFFQWQQVSRWSKTWHVLHHSWIFLAYFLTCFFLILSDGQIIAAS